MFNSILYQIRLVRLKHKINIFVFCSANYLLESLNESVDPCESFYDFTCDNWLKNTKLPDGGEPYLFFVI